MKCLFSLNPILIEVIGVIALEDVSLQSQPIGSGLI